MTPVVVVSEKVGHFACPTGLGTLVRLGLDVESEKAPPMVTISVCPACGDGHRARTALWRNPVAADEGRPPEVVVDAEGRQVCASA